MQKYITQVSKGRWQWSIKPINKSSKKVYGTGLLFYQDDNKTLNKKDDWEICFYHHTGLSVNVAIKGQLCPNNMGFKPDNKDNNYWDNFDYVMEQKSKNPDRFGTNFHDCSQAIFLMLRDKF